jgi:hypothetical protein
VIPELLLIHMLRSHALKRSRTSVIATLRKRSSRLRRKQHLGNRVVRRDYDTLKNIVECPSDGAPAILLFY